jgi:hypothetical protein
MASPVPHGLNELQGSGTRLGPNDIEGAAAYIDIEGDRSVHCIPAAGITVRAKPKNIPLRASLTEARPATSLVRHDQWKTTGAVARDEWRFHSLMLVELPAVSGFKNRASESSRVL